MTLGPFDYLHSLIDKYNLFPTVILILVQVGLSKLRLAVRKLPTLVDECLQGLAQVVGSIYVFRMKLNALKTRYEISRAHRSRLVD